MQYRNACFGTLFQAVENVLARSPAVYRQDSSVGPGTCGENMAEYRKLVIPSGAERGRSVKAYFSDMAALRQEFIKPRKFGPASSRKLRVQT